MGTPEENLYQEVLTAIKNRENDHARDLLTRLIKMNPNNSEYWLWLSAAVETVRERVYCLKEVLRLDPENRDARIGLAMFGEMPVDPQLVIPLSVQRRDWETEFERTTQIVQKSPLQWVQIAPFAGAFIFLAVLAGFLLWGTLGKGFRLLSPVEATVDLGPTLTYAPTLTVVAAALSTPKPGVTPSGIFLLTTYTPTPVYVNTPHSNEAYRIAQRALGRNDIENALKNFKLAVTLEPAAADLVFFVGEAYFLKGDLTAAAEAYRQAMKIQPDFAPPYLGLARVDMKSEPPLLKTAREYLDKAILLDPNLNEAYIELANLNLAQDNPQAALDQLNLAPGSIRTSPLFYYYRALAELRTDQVIGAIADARLANKMDITFLPAYRLLGEALLLSSLPGDAAAPLAIFVQYEQEDAQAWDWLGQAYQLKREQEKSLAAFSQALAINPNLFDSYLHRGLIYLELKNGQKAQSDMTAALRIQPRSFAANIGLGRALMLEQMFGNAWKQFATSEAFIKTDSERAEMLYWRAQSLEKLNVIDGAIGDFQAMLALPTSSVPQEWMDYAKQRISGLRTITPSLTVPTKTLTATLQPSQRDTPTPSSTLTLSQTPTATSTSSLTPTPAATAAQ